MVNLRFWGLEFQDGRTDLTAKFQNTDATDAIINAIDVHSSTPVGPGAEVHCPGEGEYRRRCDYLANGIPVAEEKRNEVLTM